MDVVTIVSTTALTALVGGVVGAATGGFIGGLSRTGHKHIEHEKAMHEGMSALLWREMKSIHANATKRGGMTWEERKQLEYVYSAYSGLGYNDTGKRLYEESMDMDILE